MANSKQTDEIPAMQSFTVASRGFFEGTYVITGVSYEDACNRFAEQFKSQLVRVVAPGQTPTSKVGPLLGKLNANKIGKFEPSQLKCVGANADGKPIFRAKLPSWNGTKTERRTDPTTGEERKVKIPVVRFASIEMPQGEVLKDVLRDAAA